MLFSEVLIFFILWCKKIRANTFVSRFNNILAIECKQILLDCALFFNATFFQSSFFSSIEKSRISLCVLKINDLLSSRYCQMSNFLHCVSCVKINWVLKFSSVYTRYKRIFQVYLKKKTLI